VGFDPKLGDQNKSFPHFCLSISKIVSFGIAPILMPPGFYLVFRWLSDTQNIGSGLLKYNGTSLRGNNIMRDHSGIVLIISLLIDPEQSAPPPLRITHSTSLRDEKYDSTVKAKID
jgi:hypothetical protein